MKPGAEMRVQSRVYARMRLKSDTLTVAQHFKSDGVSRHERLYCRDALGEHKRCRAAAVDGKTAGGKREAGVARGGCVAMGNSAGGQPGEVKMRQQHAWLTCMPVGWGSLGTQAAGRGSAADDEVTGATRACDLRYDDDTIVAGEDAKIRGHWVEALVDV